MLWWRRHHSNWPGPGIPFACRLTVRPPRFDRIDMRPDHSRHCIYHILVNDWICRSIYSVMHRRDHQQFILQASAVCQYWNEFYGYPFWTHNYYIIITPISFRPYWGKRTERLENRNEVFDGWSLSKSEDTQWSVTERFRVLRSSFEVTAVHKWK